jgi:hypothetical protein
MIKKLLRVSVCLAVALNSIAVPAAIAQESGAGQNDTPLEVIARDGADKEKHLFSMNGTVPMLRVRQNQTVPLTLQFPATAAGMPVALVPLDGGRVSGGGNGRVLPTGRMLFTFQPGAIAGRYRVMLDMPGEQHLLEFYVVDPAHPPFRPRAGH